VQAEFGRLTKNDTCIDGELRAFLDRTFNLTTSARSNTAQWQRTAPPNPQTGQ
jgi:hypothetical protein